MTDDFTILTEKDKKHVAYGLCVLGTAATGATFGSIAGGQTLPGFLIGGVAGLLMCKTVAKPLKQYLFSSRPMSETQFQSLASQTQRAYPRLAREQVLDLLAASRLAAMKSPRKYRC